jgi:hypothetical protein
MVLLCRNINEHFNINTYRNNIIKYRLIDTYNIANIKLSNTDEVIKLKKNNLENNKILEETKNMYIKIIPNETIIRFKDKYKNEERRKNK